MNITTPTASPAAASGTHSPAPDQTTRNAAEFVVLAAEALWDLSDDSLMTYIEECSCRMLAADARYRKSSEWADKGDRDRFWLAERLALTERGRRPAMVAAMERRIGLA